MNRIVPLCRILGLGFWLVLGPMHALQAETEDALKASYLYKFTKFIEWPPETGQNQIFCILGEEKSDLFREALAGKQSQGQPIILVDARRRSDLRTCRVLYIDSAESWKSTALLQELQGKPVLTVSDAPGFAAQGGMIELQREGEHLRFSLNRIAALKAGLIFSAPLLELAVRLY